MVKFLIHRPIAVIMAFIALLLLGIITVFTLPVSLMPDIDIPEITVQATASGTPAREMENTVTSNLRQQLMQVAHLENLESETRDGYGIIRMRFAHGTDVNLAYIEANEKIDDAMNYLPRGFDRPRVVRASATDIPVFNLLVTMDKDWQDKRKFMEMSEFVQSVIKKRIEQLPEVAMVDVTGSVNSELVITPDRDKMKNIGITDKHIVDALESNNTPIGNLMVRDGFYQYQIKFSNYLKNEADIRNLYLRNGERLIQLKDIASVELKVQKSNGIFLNRNKPGLCLAIIKQSDAQIEGLKDEVTRLMDEYRSDYSFLNFEIEKDQSALLTYSMQNLRQSLWLGGLLAILVMFVFLKDFRSPILIAFSVPVSLVICMLCFFLFGLSLNIISLSGLVLAVGMMIDNSIIVIDNINQYIKRGKTVDEACVEGTNEVIRPLISSGLTTCAVFLPLIFLSGIAGALFYDQALSVTIGLFVSFFVSITLVPTLFRLFSSYRRNTEKPNFIGRLNRVDYEAAYEKSFRHVFRYKWIYLVVFLLFIGSAYPLFKMVGVSQLPEVEQTELIARIDWNEPIHIEENSKRVEKIINSLSDSIIQFSSLIGEQQFILHRDAERTVSEAELYFRLEDPDSVQTLQTKILCFIESHYPVSAVKFQPPDNLFEAVFSENTPPLVIRLSGQDGYEQPSLQTVWEFFDTIAQTEQLFFEQIPVQDQIVIQVNPERLMLYGIDYVAVTSQLERAFSQKNIGMLKSYQSFIPIMLADDVRSVTEIVNESFVTSKSGIDYPLKNLLSVGREQQYKSIFASRNGEYVPVVCGENSGTPPDIIRKIKDGVRNSSSLQAEFDGTWFSRRVLIRELMLVLLISVLLLYFILAAQFESFVQPLIVLVELPIDIAAALLMLWIFGGTLNLMSAIGIIVMAGIIINDSILKIDTINRTRTEGFSLMDSIHIAGRRRLKPIIMTSLTTALGMLPFLFFKGLGSDLQKPLALTIIGGMTMGTLVSVYIVPVIYWLVYRKGEERKDR